MIRSWCGADALARLACLDDFHAGVVAPPGQVLPGAAVWSDYHASWTPLLVEALECGETVAAMGLAVRRWRGMIEARRLGPDDEEMTVAAAGPAEATVLGRAVCSRLTEADRHWTLRLANVAGGPTSEAFVRTLPRAKAYVSGRCPQAVFVPGEPLGRYVTRKMRDNAHRAYNLAAAAGTPLVPCWVTDPDEIQEVLPDVIEVHRARNQQARGYAILDSPAEASQFRAQVLAHARTGTAHLLVIRGAGELAAFSVCFTNGRLMRVYANLVSPQWLHVSAGTLASVEVVRRAHADPGIDVLSWGAGESRYKSSCSTTTCELTTILGFSSPPTQLAWGALRARRRHESSSDTDGCVEPQDVGNRLTERQSP